MCVTLDWGSGRGQRQRQRQSDDVSCGGGGSGGGSKDYGLPRRVGISKEYTPRHRHAFRVLFTELSGIL